MIRSFLKYFFLFVVACACSIALYYYVVPNDERVPISIEISEKK